MSIEETIAEGWVTAGLRPGGSTQAQVPDRGRPLKQTAWRPTRSETTAADNGAFGRDVEAGFAISSGEIAEVRRRGEVVGEARTLALLARLVEESEIPVSDVYDDVEAVVKLSAAGLIFAASSRLFPSDLGRSLCDQLRVEFGND